MTWAVFTNRRLGLALAACCYGAVFAAFVLLERPGLGIGHFFYLPICLIALSTDAVGGIVAGLVAAAVYCVAVIVDPRIPSSDALTAATAIRSVTFAAVGAIIGLSARRNRELVARLHNHASRDFVTGVANVRAFVEELERRCATGLGFSLVLLDVDGLRRVNEVHGHHAGDAALKRVAAAIATVAESGDLVARVGGDEFALVTTRPPEELPQLTARVNAILAADDLAVTAAATAAPADGQAVDDLFRKADDRLFAAKLLQANRTTLAAV